MDHARLSSSSFPSNFRDAAPHEEDWNKRIKDPMKELCPTELETGVCEAAGCAFEHFGDSEEVPPEI